MLKASPSASVSFPSSVLRDNVTFVLLDTHEDVVRRNRIIVDRVTVMFAVSVALEYAVDPPLTAVSTLVPAVPVVWSQARNVTASVTLPLKFALAWK